MEQDKKTMQDEQRNTVLKVKSLSKSYVIPNGKLGVLQDVSMEVQQGKCI